MLDAQRKAYLTAMGIETWRLRTHPDAPVEEKKQRLSDENRSAHHSANQASNTGDPPMTTQDKPLPDWSELIETVSTCRQCALSKTRTQTVFGVGNQQADLMIVGEAPGGEEDRQGQPFVGRAGQLLTAMLKAIGLSREQVYIANVLKCRPPGNRDPMPQEVEACRAYLDQQIALIQPRLILSVGGVSAKNLLQTDQPVGRLRGRTHQYAATRTPLMVTYHPAYLLRRPEEKAKVWMDLQQVVQQLAIQ